MPDETPEELAKGYTISLTPSLRKRAEARRLSLGHTSFSAYVTFLVERDLAQGGPHVLGAWNQPAPSMPPSNVIPGRFVVSAPRRTGTITLPELGTIAAGDGDSTDGQEVVAEASMGYAADYYAEVPAYLKDQGAAFVLRVKGDSMNAAHPDPIYNGDRVVMATGRAPRDGDIIACLIGGKTTLKRLMIESETGRPVLVSESTNPAHRNIMPMEGMTWQGVMLGKLQSSPE